ncbi:hypothetical protein FNV43_RR04863 [Rhamnella rubrinervis]|uniref:Uncharacterized protein n=1 Tax=Rhamnella rubrinervis TaxID=2594499 RepID=A0A8K0MPZ5_9ROSA|nr:hypothetical protein FNV43_RR04863 [Rhamnella rubrinervis]
MIGCLYPSPVSDAMPGGTNDQPAHPAAQATSGERKDQPAYPAAQATSGEREVESDPSSANLGSSRNGNGNVKDDNEFQSVEATASKKKEPEPTIAPQAKAPEKVVSIKKTVSINDRVEEIDKIMKERKKRKSLEKLNSLQKEEDEPQPLRSILKVGSNLDDNADTCVNLTTSQ